jgi:hypothetical protein
MHTEDSVDDAAAVDRSLLATWTVGVQLGRVGVRWGSRADQ